MDDVVAETGWPEDKVTRYAEPPLRERAYIVELAQRAYVRGTSGTTVLLDLVSDTWRGAAWDAYRGEDGRWRVTASNDRQTATWIYEPTGRTVHALDAAATQILGSETPAPAPPAPTPASPAPTPAPPAVEDRPRLVSVPSPQPAEPVHATPVDEVPTRPSKKSRRGRARVPSWDEILFGATRSED